MNSLLLILRNRRYFAPAWVFASLNVIIGTWVLYIPMVKDRLGIDEGQLGLALFIFSIGMLTIIPFSASIIRLVGTGRMTVIGICSFATAMALPVLAPTYFALCGALFTAGLLVSLTDISMNSLVSEREREDDAHFMSAAHGFFSLGGVIGAGIGSLLIGLFTHPVYHSLVVALFILLTNGFLASSYWDARSPETVREADGGKFRLSLIKPLLGLTLLALLVMGSEGAIEHWSKLYLLDVVQVRSDQLAGFGFVAFSATMTLGRFLGDGISKNFGALKLIIAGTLVASIGFVSVLLGDFNWSVLGFALVGLGFSVVIPELFRLAGRAEGISAAEGISVVGGMGYVGLVASPAVLGFLADWSSLWLSFATLLGASLAACAIASLLLIRSRQKSHTGGRTVPTVPGKSGQ